MEQTVNQEQNQKEPLQEADLVKYVEDKLKQGEKRNYETQGYLNIAYFAGKQWVALDKVNNKLIEPPKESWQVRYIANRIQPIVRTELAKITKNKFIMMVVPASNEDDDIKASRVAEKVTEWLEYELDLQEKDQDMGLWGLTTGIGFMKPYWNSTKGVEVEKGTHQGDVDADAISFFELKWDMSANKWVDVKWACHEKVRSCDYIKQVYGVDVPPETGVYTTNIYEAQLKDLNILGQGLGYKVADNCAIVKEYWELPSCDYPKGRRITVANGKKLFYEEDIGFGEKDDTERELPFFPFFHIKVPGRVIPTCVTEQMIPVQREYNKSRSQIIENKNLMSNPIWLVAKGSMSEDITNMPAGIYEYNPAMPRPEMVQPASMGADVYRNIDQCIEEFEFVSGQHETSHGAVPSGVTSGTAIQFLQEQDDTKLGPTISNFIRCKQKYVRYLLKMIQKKYDIERTIKLVGQNKKIEVVSFTGSDLTSIDVRVQEGTMFQLSKSAKQDWIMQLITNKVLDPSADKGLIIKMLELGITDDMYDQFEFDVNHAQNENDKWKKGDMTPIVRDFYNHEVHVSEHNKFRKNDDYINMKPEQQKAIDDHVAQHMNFIAQKVIPTQTSPQPQQGNNQQFEEMAKFVETLPPDVQAKLKALPDAQYEQEVMKLMQGGGKGGGQPQMPNM